MRLRAALPCALALLTGGAGAAELGYRLGQPDGQDAALLRCAFLEQPWTAETGAAVEKGAAETFPVRAADLLGRYSGPALGAKLAELESRWIASDFTLDRDALLQY